MSGASPSDGKGESPGGGRQLPTRRSARVAAALERVWELSPEEQRQAFQALAEYLAVPADEETAIERVARERVEVLEDTARVAAHLELPEGRGPTQAQYEALRVELGLRYRATKIAELYVLTWAIAEMSHGGISTYLWNSSGDTTEALASCARLVRAGAYADLLEEVRSLFPPVDLSSRLYRCDWLEVHPEAERQLDSLTERLYVLEDSDEEYLAGRMHRYVVEHPDEFFTDPS